MWVAAATLKVDSTEWGGDRLGERGYHGENTSIGDWASLAWQSRDALCNPHDLAVILGGPGPVSRPPSPGLKFEIVTNVE